MIAHYLSAVWAAVASALADHLWQSTLFAVAASLLTLALRRNSARVRYILWLAASLKFLVPFSVLIVIGSHLSWRHTSPQTAGLYLVEELGQPFTQSPQVARPAVLASSAAGTLIHWLPLLLALWVCGFLVVLCIWTARWWGISAAIRKSVPLSEGRELSTLRRIERLAGLRQGMRLFLSRASMEPGVFGILRPVLLWPDSISEHLDDAHLEAILAHELCHVRRRDNLAAAAHMLVEAIFWFHPLVWWLGSRLIEEREHACDEAVLELGSHRHIYAESILKVCEFCLSSPLTCVSGVTGADLKKRMVHIMTDRIAHKLDITRQLLLGTAAVTALAAPLIFGLFSATSTRAEAQTDGSLPAVQFESVSIKPVVPDPGVGPGPVNRVFRLMFPPDGFSAKGVTMRMLIREAFGIEDDRIVGAPEEFDSQAYDIEAKLDASTTAQLRSLPNGQRKLANQKILQALLADRFKLSFHNESKGLTSYSLVVAPNGPKLQKSSSSGEHSAMFQVGVPGDSQKVMTQRRMEAGETADQEPPMGTGVNAAPANAPRMLMTAKLPGGQMAAVGLPMGELAHFLSRELGATVIDKTNLPGEYDVTLHWAPNDPPNGMRFRTGTPAGASPGTASGPEQDTASRAHALAATLQQQLGLTLHQQTGPVDALVIDHVEQPAAN